MVKSVSLDAWNAFCYDGMYLVDGNSKKYSRQIFSEVFPIHWAAVLIKMYQNKSKHICKLAKTQHLFGEITRHIFFGCCSVWIPLSTKRQTRFFYFNQKKHRERNWWKSVISIRKTKVFVTWLLPKSSVDFKDDKKFIDGFSQWFFVAKTWSRKLQKKIDFLRKINDFQ